MTGVPETAVQEEIPKCIYNGKDLAQARSSSLLETK